MLKCGCWVGGNPWVTLPKYCLRRGGECSPSWVKIWLLSNFLLSFVNLTFVSKCLHALGEIQLVLGAVSSQLLILPSVLRPIHPSSLSPSLPSFLPSILSPSLPSISPHPPSLQSSQQLAASTLTLKWRTPSMG